MVMVNGGVQKLYIRRTILDVSWVLYPILREYMYVDITPRCIKYIKNNKNVVFHDVSTLYIILKTKRMAALPDKVCFGLLYET